jgi:cation diffusion facilitator CzcD-associated flavoprotein CzcO
MSFSQEPFPEERSALNISRHGPQSPFRHWKAVEVYIQNLLDRRGYQETVSYNTTVELVHKDTETGKWVLTLRRPENGVEDYWWSESFDAVLVAAGHYTVPFIPSTPGLAELSKNFPGSVEHSKSWRTPDKYRGKRVVVVGASISGTDISFNLAEIAETPLNSVVRGKYRKHYPKKDSNFKTLSSEYI